MSSSRSVAPRSHRQIGEQLDLFHFPGHSPGMVCWHPRGLRAYRALEALIRDLHDRYGYEEVRSPLVCDQRLWERSGHADKFAEKMFSLAVDGHPAALKPMNCPGHCELFAHRPRSYRELPLRVAELGHVHRLEQSGEVNGLLRGRSFVIDDAHLFCRDRQVADEVDGCLRMAAEVYDLFGLAPRAELSLRPAQRIGADALWDRAEQALADALDHNNISYERRPGEGAFYGPKIDLHVSDRLGRSWQLGSVQLDYQLPQRFGLSFVDERGAGERPVIVHRALMGSLERFFGVLLEADDGWLPDWMSPQVVAVCPVSEAQAQSAGELVAALRDAGVSAGLSAGGPLGGRIRVAHEQRVLYVAVIGSREAQSGMVAVRDRDRRQQVMAVDEFVARLRARIRGRAR